jgi:hypothetical protein
MPARKRIKITGIEIELRRGAENEILLPFLK